MATFILVPEIDGDQVYVIVEHIEAVKPLDTAGNRTRIDMISGTSLYVDMTPIGVMTAAGYVV